MDRVPVSSLDDFVHTYTLLPCTFFLRECTEETIRLEWYNTLHIALDTRQHNSHLSPGLLRDLQRQLTDSLQSVSSSHSVSDGVQPICNPDRTRHMYELYHGTHVHRTHIEALLQIEQDPLAREQTSYLKETILATFPPDGLQTTCTTDLVTLFLDHVCDVSVY
jgi:hypothetical protein